MRNLRAWRLFRRRFFGEAPSNEYWIGSTVRWLSCVDRLGQSAPNGGCGDVIVLLVMHFSGSRTTAPRHRAEHTRAGDLRIRQEAARSHRPAQNLVEPDKLAVA